MRKLLEFRRQAPVESEFLPEICDPVPDAKDGNCLKKATVSKSLEELAREVARVQGQPAGKEESSESGDESGPLLVPKSAPIISGRQQPFSHTDRPFDVSGCKVGEVTPAAMRYENPRSTKILSNCASDVPQVGEGGCAPPVRKRRNRRCTGHLLKKCSAL